MVTIYADILFLLNTLVDYLLILITGRIAGIPLCRKRYWAAAVLGGGYAVLAIIPCLQTILASVPFKVLGWIVISAIAYGFSHQIIKLILLFGGTACSLAGVVLAMANFFDMKHFIVHPLIVPFSAILFLLGNRIFHTAMRHNVSGTIFQSTLSIDGNTLNLPTLLDTGNCLKHPITGQPILVVSLHALDSILPISLRHRFSQHNLTNPSDLSEFVRSTSPDLNPQLISYRSLGCSSGLLLTLQTDWIQIKTHRYPKGVVALAPTPLGFGYSALWGGELKGDF
jgi:stage II sporulation protein GA (sporulation sigma-E factor processing peptidase)